uniref:Borealin C-terminal domain-containing protein n=1 Tax=Amblyomma americanum TaxID=6943 RepID=A0A0C9R1T2_AMBAM
MPRTKKGHSRDSSLLPGTTVSPESIRYLEVMVDELKCTMDSSVAAAKAIAKQIHRQADMWFDNMMRMVPEEILNRPYMEVLDSGFIIPTPETTAVSTAGATLNGTETSGDSTSSASMQSRLKKLAASAKTKRAPSQRGSMAKGKKKASEEPASSKPRKMMRKASMHTPTTTRRMTGKFPVVTPKFDIRKRPITARKARQGEMLLSLLGSPVNSKTVEVTIHVHLNNGEVMKVVADPNSNSSVQKLCKTIKELCKK